MFIHPTTNLLKDCLTSFYKIQSSTIELHKVNASQFDILHDNNIKFNINTNHCLKVYLVTTNKLHDVNYCISEILHEN